MTTLGANSNLFGGLYTLYSCIEMAFAERSTTQIRFTFKESSLRSVGRLIAASLRDAAQGVSE